LEQERHNVVVVYMHDREVVLFHDEQVAHGDAHDEQGERQQYLLTKTKVSKTYWFLQ
jgi:hypothetical protein